MSWRICDPGLKKAEQNPFSCHRRVSEAAAIGAESIDSEHEELSLEVGIEEQGYLFTYLSDEGEENMDLYYLDCFRPHCCFY